MKKRIILGIIISIFFLYLVLRNIDFKSIIDVISNGNYLWILPTIITCTLGFIFRSVRWRYLLLPVKKFHWRQLFSSLVMGFAANYIFPLRFGEVVRAYIVGKKHQISKSASFATIVLERIMDGLGILILLCLSVPFLPVFPPWIKHTILIAIVLFLVVFVVLTVLILKKHFVDHLKKIPFIKYELKERIVNKIKKFIVGFEIIKDIKNFSVVLLFSICVWVFETLNLFFLVRIVDIHIPFSGLIFILFICVLGIIIPAAPGSIGTFEAAFVVGIMFFSTKVTVITKETAFATALIAHSIGGFYVMSLGLYYFFKEGISYKEISESR
ncbi:MAG: lysylphosphatidylglycerol synthase transmembrane domain-containing protein [Elusimicrobiota bacterium]